MYISKVIVSHKVVRRMRTDHYALHKLVYSMVGSDHRPLFVANSKEGTLEILMKHSVDCTPVDGISIMTKKYEIPVTGSLVAFELVANPSVTRTEKGSKPKRFLSDDVEGWLTKRDLGLAIKSLEIENSGVINVKGASIPTYTYSGRALVKDATKLQTVINSGVGREKAFGCGLLKTWLINS